MTSLALADVEAEADRLIQLTSEAGLVVRLLGGLGIAQHRHGPVPAVLHRRYGDIDVIVRRGHDGRLRTVLEGSGYAGNRRFNSLHGDRRLMYGDTANGRRLDVFIGDFAMCHTLELDDRLGEDDRSLTPADLLLTKLQVVEINQKDILDVATLLLTHPVEPAAGTCHIDGHRVTQVAAADWGWYTTLGINLERVGPVAAQLLDQRDALLVTDRAAALLAVIADAPKSRRWKVRARVGRRFPWYEPPEEVGGPAK